jgi:hypothetical protein
MTDMKQRRIFLKVVIPWNAIPDPALKFAARCFGLDVPVSLTRWGDASTLRSEYFGEHRRSRSRGRPARGELVHTHFAERHVRCRPHRSLAIDHVACRYLIAFGT